MDWTYIMLVAVPIFLLVLAVAFIIVIVKKIPKKNPHPTYITTPQTKKSGHWKHFDHKSFVITLVSAIFLIVVGEWFGRSREISGVGIICFIISCIYMFDSLKTVDPGQKGVLVFLGNPYKEVESGPVFAPKGITKLVTVDSRIMEKEFPTEPEKIWRAPKDDETKLPPEGFVPPTRILFGRPSNDQKYKDDPYNKRMVAEVGFYLSCQIVSVIDWVQNKGSEEKLWSEAGDTATALYNAEFTKHSPAVINDHLDEYSEQLKEDIQKIADDNKWGVKINVTRIKPIGFSHELNASVVRVGEAEQNKISKIIDAEAERIKKIKDGQGIAIAEKLSLLAKAAGTEAELKAQAIGLNELRKIIQEPGGLSIAQLKTVETALRDGKITLIAGQDGAIKSILGLVQTAINQQENPGSSK